jgi:hypothetical protein
VCARACVRKQERGRERENAKAEQWGGNRKIKILMHASVFTTTIYSSQAEYVLLVHILKRIFARS